MANAHYSRAYSEDPYDNSQQSKTFPEDASSTELQELGHTKEPVSTVYQAPPQLLRQWVGWSSIVPEASSLIFTILFWILGLAIVTLKDRPQSPWSNKVIQATKLAPSLWPILFAAVLGNAIKCFARWKAERGSRLGSLEQLTNSQTFGSTIGTIVALRTFGLYTLCLILLWGLNPLGSQASFRGVYLKERFSDGFRNLTIADSSMLSRGSDLQLGLDSNAAANLVYTTAFAAIESSTQYVNRNSDAFQILIARLGGMKSVSQSTSMDPWGNVKMPNLKLLTGYDAKSPERWVDVPGGELTNYVSLIGVPVSGIPISSTENLTFTLSAPVDNLACSPWTSLDVPSPDSRSNVFNLLNNREGYVPAPTSYNLSANMQSWFAKNYRKLTVNYNSTLDRAPYNMALGALFSNSSFFMDTDLPFSSAWEINVKHIPSRSILFGSWGNKTIDITSCALSAQYLTANVSCQSHNSTARTQCSVIAVRQMPNPPTVSNFTVLGMDPVGRGLMKVLPVVISNRGMNGSTPTEMYLADPGTTFRTDGSAVQLSATPIGVFQERLALLINSFILAARYSTLVMGREDLSGSNISVQTVTKRVSVAPAYALDGPWFGLFLLANVVMLGASLVALALKLSCSGPEVLGYVSSLTRDSPHFSMDGNFNSTVDGAERSRLMRNLRVRLGDVRLGEDTGKIAFAPLLESGVAKRGRLYE